MSRQIVRTGGPGYATSGATRFAVITVVIAVVVLAIFAFLSWGSGRGIDSTPNPRGQNQPTSAMGAASSQNAPNAAETPSQ